MGPALSRMEADTSLHLDGNDDGRRPVWDSVRR